jgi:hypothetical protein
MYASGSAKHASASTCATVLAERAGALLRDREVGSSGRGAGIRKMPRGWLMKGGQAPASRVEVCGLIAEKPSREQSLTPMTCSEPRV